LQRFQPQETGGVRPKQKKEFLEHFVKLTRGS